MANMENQISPRDPPQTLSQRQNISNQNLLTPITTTSNSDATYSPITATTTTSVIATTTTTVAGSNNSVSSNISNASSSTAKNTKNLSIKDFFTSRLMRTKSFEGGGSNSPKDETTNWFDEFKARMTKRPQKNSTSNGLSQPTQDGNQSEESNDSSENVAQPSSFSARQKIKLNKSKKHKDKCKLLETIKQQKENLEKGNIDEGNDCDNSSSNLLDGSFEEINECKSEEESHLTQDSSSVSLLSPRQLFNLRKRKIKKISSIDKPDFDTASINTIIDRRDSRYDKLRRSAPISSFCNRLTSSLFQVMRLIFIKFFPFNHTLPWKLICILNFALVIIVIGITSKSNADRSILNFINGFVCGLSAAILCLIILFFSIIVHILPESQDKSVIIKKEKVKETSDSDISKEKREFKDSCFDRSYDLKTNKEVEHSVSVVEPKINLEDYSETEILDDDESIDAASLSDDSYKGWMIEFVGDYELRNKIDVKLKLLYVKFENRILHLYKVKSNRDIDSSSFPSNVHQRIYDLKSVKKFSANLLFPKNVRNLKKWLWSKKYPMRIEFIPNHDPEGSSADISPELKVVQLTLFTKTCREKEEWFRRFKPIVEEFRLAQFGKNLNQRLSTASESKSTSFEPNLTRSFLSPKPSKHLANSLFGADTSQSSQMLNDPQACGSADDSSDARCIMSHNIVRTKSFELISGASQDDMNFAENENDIPLLNLVSPDDSTLTRANAEIFSQAVDDLDFMETRPNIDYFEYIRRVIDSTNEATKTSDWFNSLTGRIFFDVFSQNYWSDWFKKKIQRKLYRIRLPYFMETLTLTNIDLGSNAPQFLNVVSHQFDSFGLSIDFDVSYNGGLTMTFETKLNLLKIKPESNSESVSTGQSQGSQSSTTKDAPNSDSSTKDQGSVSDSGSENLSRDSSQPVVSNDNPTINQSTTRASEDSNATSDTSDSEFNSSSDSSSDEADIDEISDWEDYGAERTRQNIVKFVDKVASSRYFQQATENRYIKKKLQDISNCPLVLVVQIRSLNGVLTMNVPPPQTDRIWYGFRPNPDITLKALPKMGEREVSLSHVTDWIERKLEEEFRKILVIPNMEDIVLPVLKSDHLLYVTQTK